MAKVIVELDFKQIESIIEKLDIKSKFKLLRKLEEETRKERWEPVVSEIRKNFAKNPISDEEITEICEDVRQEIYEKRLKSKKNKSNN